MRRRGFTLIELLIVVAIIAILAAIAVPNFLEAQTRSKVSRAKADMRSMATAMEAYVVDYNHYPVPLSGQYDEVNELTTPVAYMTSIPRDVYGEAIEWGDDTGNKGVIPFSPLLYNAFNWHSFEVFGTTGNPQTWADAIVEINNADPALGRTGGILKSFGPDKQASTGEWWAFAGPVYYPSGLNSLYDPTNGTLSNGDLMRAIGSVHPEAAAHLN